MHREHALIAIRTSALTEGTRQFDFTCTAGDFKDPKIEEAGFSGPVRARVTVEKAGGEIALTIETAAECDFTCDICLAPIRRELSGSYRIFYDCSGSEAQGAPGENGDEYRILDRSAVEIDLTEDVRETLLLSVPMKVTCTGNPECRIYTETEEEQEGQEPEGGSSSWKEGLEKLKKKYR
ncbi:DUF177 domain-containing protein [Chlorobium sp. N1]|uniref:YceD family protein n=1 Tax=Chlorobium sp. N1 TaxID=2491138 RepID=UPI00103EB75C|nr:DUF177 domain-containing protein [Chlorobium sp. N1]TCD47718.1 DUF177 domain-containing protein [Chlorobium sp. N1]